MALRKSLVALGRLPQSSCPCNKPSLPRRCLWYRSIETSSKISSSEDEVSHSNAPWFFDGVLPASKSADKEERISTMTPKLKGESFLKKSIELEDVARLVDGKAELPLHIEEHLSSMHRWADVHPSEEMQWMERRVEEIYLSTTSTAEKALMETPTRGIARDRFNPLTLQRFAMKLVDCGVLRAFSVVWLVRNGCFGIATREIVDLLYSLGFVVPKTKRHRPEAQSRVIDGTSLRYYPKSLMDRPLAAIPARSWIGLPRRIERLQCDYFKIPPAEDETIIYGHALELRHGAYVMVDSVMVPHRRYQVFKGVEEGILHIFGQKKKDPFGWRHMSTFISESHWPSSADSPD